MKTCLLCRIKKQTSHHVSKDFTFHHQYSILFTNLIESMHQICLLDANKSFIDFNCLYTKKYKSLKNTADNSIKNVLWGSLVMVHVVFFYSAKRLQELCLSNSADFNNGRESLCLFLPAQDKVHDIRYRNPLPRNHLFVSSCHRMGFQAD